MAETPTSTSRNNLRAVSAARMTPLPPTARRVTGEMMAVGAKDTALNVAGILRDFFDDFKSSDRFFKYKAMVAVLWLGLSVTSVGVACPSGGGSTNAFGARLVVAGDSSAPIYMVKNDSPTPWQDVAVVVNGKYRSTAAQVEANREITLSPVVLYDDTGARAPTGLKITDITVQIGDGFEFGGVIIDAERRQDFFGRVHEIKNVGRVLARVSAV